MGFMDRVKDFVAPSDEDEEDIYEEEEIEVKPKPKRQTTQSPQQSRYEKSSQGNLNNLSDNTKMVLFEPRSFGEAEEAGMRLKENRAVVVNLHKLDREYAQRTIDFLTGVVFALDGNIQRIGQNVILCYPASIGVSGTISLSQPEEEIEEVDIYES